MDVRRLLLTLCALIASSSYATAQVFVGQRSVVESPNFRVFARTPALANEIAAVAEQNRKQLAVHWLGQEIPNWPQPCPLVVHDSPNGLANGETKYTLVGGGVTNFNMTVAGTKERIIDSVIPHEITHTILASHFGALGKPVPRWADEGACTTVEHESERSKHDHMLVRYLSEGRGIPFATLFSLRDYPPDMMPLYAQGYSLSCFLIAQGGQQGPRQFVKFLERGMETEDWVTAIDEFYQYPKLGKLQVAWNRWVSDGGGVVNNYTADSLGLSTRTALATTARNSSGDVRTASAIVPQDWNQLPNNKNLTGSVPANIAVASPSLNELNNSMNTSSESYYAEQLRRNQSNQMATGPTASPTPSLVPGANAGSGMPTRAIPYRASQPGPFQTPGSGTVWR